MSFFDTLKTVQLLTPEAFESYLQTLLSTNTDEDDDQLSDFYEPYMINEEGIETQWEECHQFLKANNEVVQQLVEEGYEIETIMHDFCLTRNREGAGFWDGDYPEFIGQQLTTSAQQFSEVSLYIGDDGGIYVSAG